MKQRFRYSVAQRVLASNLPLPELSAIGTGGKAAKTIAIQFLPYDLDEPEVDDWFHSWESPADPRKVEVRVAKMAAAYVVEFPGYGRFLVSQSGDRIRCFRYSDIPAVKTRRLLLDHVVPLALGLGGDVVLHASATVQAGQAVGFCGSSGMGKSTLVAHLGLNGARALTDDCLVLRRVKGVWHAVPYYQGIRLWTDSLRQLAPGAAEPAGPARSRRKRRIRTHERFRFERSAAPLKAVVFLDAQPREAQSVELSGLSRREALFRALAESFFFEFGMKQAIQRQFESLSDLVELVPAYTLKYPRRFEFLPRVRSEVLSLFPGEPALGAAA